MFKQHICWKSLRQAVANNKGKLVHTSSESPPQYDISEKMRKLFETKQKQREATKAYFQKIVMNPYRAKVDPVPFDPVVFRYNALMTYNADYLKPNMKNTGAFIAFYIMPIVLLSWFFYTTKGNYEKHLRAGEIAYKDRRNKGLL